MFAIGRIYYLLTAIVPSVFTQMSEHKEEKIIGNEAKLEDYPFLAHLTIVEGMFGAPRSWPCGGSCIRPEWVLTSAVCLQLDHYETGVAVSDDAVEVRMGLRRAEPEQVKTITPIKSVAVIRHPDLAGKEDHVINNIGLVRLERAIDSSPTIGTIDLTSTVMDYSRKVTMAGYSTITWIRTEDPDSPPGYMKLRSLTVPVWPKSKCDVNIHGGTQICLGEPQGMIWGYDLGGPLIYNKQLIGVTAPNMNQIYNYGVFEDVFAHKDWIETAITSEIKTRKTSSVQRLKATSIVYLFIYLIVYVIKFM